MIQPPEPKPQSPVTKEEILNSFTMLRIIAGGLTDVRGIVMRDHISKLESYIDHLESEE